MPCYGHAMLYTVAGIYRHTMQLKGAGAETGKEPKVYKRRNKVKEERPGVTMSMHVNE